MRWPARWGIAAKLAATLAAMLLVGILVVGALVYRNAEEVLQESAARQLDHTAEVVDLHLRDYLADLKTDIQFLAATPAVRRASRTMNGADGAEGPVSDDVVGTFEAFLRQHPEYFQARLIGRSNDGRERVRVEREGGEVIVTPLDSLQAKGHRDYFQAAMQLPPDTLYISDINLNREYGRIEQPEIPTLRAAVPLYADAGEPAGIVVLNVDFGRVMRQLQARVPDPMEFYLANSRGDFLIHPDSGMAFGFERGTPHPIQETFPKAAPFLRTESGLSRLLQIEPEVHYLRRLGGGSDRASLKLLLGLTAPYDAVFAGVRDVQRSTMLVMLLLALVAVGLAVTFGHLLARPLQRIGRAAERLGRGDDPAVDGDLPTGRTDEIGVLAGAFAEMSTRLREQMEALVEARNRAEDANRMKSVFLANMSHEIRTPLSVMVGYGTLLEEELEGQHQEYAQSIARGGRRLTETLTSVLTLAQLEGRGEELDLTSEPLNVAREVEEVASLFEREAEQKGLTLAVHVAPEARSAHANLDRGGLTSILQNLIGNALKFTERGAVTVLVERPCQSSRTASDGTGDEVLIHVEDTGIGMSDSFVDTVFEPFVQESTGYTRGYEGSGLGLAIAKQLADRMGGTLSVESVPEEGSHFTLRFPLSPAPRLEERSPQVSPSEKTAPEPPASSGAPQRILVVEDNYETRLLVKLLLEESYELEQAATAEAGRAAASEAAERGRPFDAVLVDINLGDGADGTDLLRRLREMPSYAETPVAAVTAYALPGDRGDLIAHGFTEYLSKPFRPDQLRELVEHLLSAEAPAA